MSWEKIWIPENLPLLSELPENAKIYGEGSTYRTCLIEKDIWYECKKHGESIIGCGGWIKGFPLKERIDTIGPLSGRKGEIYRCRKCGRELAFWGAMS